MEKLAYALVVVAQKLIPYFESHTIEMVTTFLLQIVLNKLDLAGQMALWATKLGAFDIKYIPQTTMKSQVIVDFLAEFAVSIEEVMKKLGTLSE